jgi:hypothetical protein
MRRGVKFALRRMKSIALNGGAVKRVVTMEEALLFRLVKITAQPLSKGVPHRGMEGL